MEEFFHKHIFKITFIICLPLWTAYAFAGTQAKIGGTFENFDESAQLTSSLDSKWELENYQGTFEADYTYKKDDSEGETVNKFNTNGKLIKDLTEKHYMFGIVSYDYDKFRTNNDRTVGGIGHGYKLLRTERMKASIENSIAYLVTDGSNEPIIRSSLWYNFKISDNVAFNNKFLWESGDEDYTRNETSFDYNLTDNVTVGLKNTYTKDPIEYSIFNITLGVKF
jgi:putative salt-induced outer membrane protein YdiY